jgi:hypothetical protein
LVDFATRGQFVHLRTSLYFIQSIVKYRDIVTYSNMLVITGMNELLYSYVEVKSKLSLLRYGIVLLGYPSNQIARVE